MGPGVPTRREARSRLRGRPLRALPRRSAVPAVGGPSGAYRELELYGQYLVLSPGELDNQAGVGLGLRLGL